MAPSSSPPPSLSRQLLVADPKSKLNPKPGQPTANSNSACSSSTAGVPLPGKRTRYQPNLFDCHSCGRRVNRDNPRDRLQPLDSVWRIVLLCRKCRKNVHSGYTCSYCFQEMGSSEDICQCSTCEHKIHNDCVRGYGDSRPWCYLGVGLEGFGVCVDCWVPELLKNSVNICRRSENKGGLKVSAEAKHPLEKMVKVKMVGNAKEEALKKTMSTLGLTNVAESATTEVAVDAGMNLELLAYKRDKNRRSWDLNNENILVCETSRLQKVKTNAYLDDSKIETPMTADVSEGLVCLNANQVNLSTIVGRFGLVYKRTKFRHKVYKENGSVDMLEGPIDVNGPCNDVNGLNLGLFAHNCEDKRKIWDIWQVNEENTVMYEASLQKVKFDKNLDDIRARSRLKSSTDITEYSLDVNGRCNDDNGLSLGLLLYKRDRKRKIWDIHQLNDENTVVSEAILKKVTSSPIKDGLDISKVSSDVSCPCNDADGLDQALLPYKHDRKRRIWGARQITDKNTVVPEGGSEKINFNLHLVDGRASSPMKSDVDLSEGSIGVNGPCYDVDELNPGMLPYKRDKMRRVWDILQLNDENTVVSNASPQKVKLHLHFADVGISSQLKYGADISKGPNDVHGSCNDNGLNLGLLPYKRDEKRKIWDIWQLNDENTI